MAGGLESARTAATLRGQNASLLAAENKSRGALLNAYGELSAFGAPIADASDVLAGWTTLVSWAHAAVPHRERDASEFRVSGKELDDAVERLLRDIDVKCAAIDLAVSAGQLASTTAFGQARSTEAAIKQIDDNLATIDRLNNELAEFAASHPVGDSSLVVIDAQLELIRAAELDASSAKETLSGLTGQLNSARAEQEVARETERVARGDFLSLHTEFAAYGAPAPAGQDLKADWEGLASWGAAESIVQVDQATDLGEGADKAAEQAGLIAATLHDECTINEIALLQDQAASESALVAAESARGEAKRIDEDLAKAAGLRDSLLADQQNDHVATELARLLKADQFEKWVLDDTLTQLVEGATEMLAELSGGQFSLAYEDGDFLVIDHRNADQTRHARTLSGGETFLASLSLALSLADQLASFVGGRAARLDALFLDEGFGTPVLLTR